MRRSALMGLVAVIALALFSTPVFAYYQSPVDFSDDGYIRFGDDDNPRFAENGLELDIVHESISHSWIDLYMGMWGPLVDDRQIDKFLVLANGKVVEEFYPQLVDSVDGPVWANYYPIKVSVPELIGSTVYFQVVAVNRDSNNPDLQYAVAWSTNTEEIRMDDLPVKDKEAISVLNAILEKLKELANLLSQMLQELKEQTRPTPEKLNEFYNAVQGLLDKMPMKQVSDELQELNDKLQDARNGLASPHSILVLGGQVDLLPDVPGGEVMFMDLTPYREQIITFRKIMQAAIWVFFFHMLFKWVTPRPGV